MSYKQAYEFSDNFINCSRPRGGGMRLHSIWDLQTCGELQPNHQLLSAPLPRGSGPPLGPGEEPWEHTSHGTSLGAEAQLGEEDTETQPDLPPPLSQGEQKAKDWQREREKKSFHLQSSRPIVDGGMGGRGGDGARGLHHGGGARLHPRPRPGLQQAPPDTETQCSPVSKGESEQEMAYQSNPHHKWECKIVQLH